MNVRTTHKERADDAPRPTRGATLTEALAEAIVAGELAPGDRLDEASLARRYGVSRTPVREALRQLAAIELVDLRPHRGAVVAGIAESRVVELFEALGEAEAACARLAAVKAGTAERQRIEALHRICREAMAAGDRVAIPVTNRHWHEALYTSAHNGFLADQALTLRRRLAPFTHAQFGLADRPPASADEHERVMAALRRRDGDAAGAAMRRHVASVGLAWQAWAAVRAEAAALQPMLAR